MFVSVKAEADRKSAISFRGILLRGEVSNKCKFRAVTGASESPDFST